MPFEAMKTALICVFIAFGTIAVHALDQAKLESHHKKLKEKLCDPDNIVAGENLDLCVACHEKFVPKNVLPFFGECENKSGDIKNLKSGDEVHDKFLSAWCSSAVQTCVFQKLIAAVATGKLSKASLLKDTDKLDDDIKCIADIVGATLD